mmetsp:Transcript_73641/g.227553  ORF Transcript_73641/g.227553 Transcript_73641/m.227553 type:complete len:208 (+) Transcript_73641:579-1202(+)
MDPSSGARGSGRRQKAFLPWFNPSGTYSPRRCCVPQGASFPREETRRRASAGWEVVSGRFAGGAPLGAPLPQRRFRCGGWACPGSAGSSIFTRKTGLGGRSGATQLTCSCTGPSAGHCQPFMGGSGVLERLRDQTWPLPTSSPNHQPPRSLPSLSSQKKSLTSGRNFCARVGILLYTLFPWFQPSSAYWPMMNSAEGGRMSNGPAEL